ncbi:MAG TPA: hypothetical protein VGI46_17280 [Candidatus Acidoferrum sp.]|jgi:hypothetical protein
MELEDRVRKAIQEIAQHRNNVRLSEIEWVMEKLGQSYKTRRREARHGVLFGIETHRFMANKHNPGSAQIKRYSVDAFIDVMEELGLYEEKEPKNE